jgi:hypothetical protein
MLVTESKTNIKRPDATGRKVTENAPPLAGGRDLGCQSMSPTLSVSGSGCVTADGSCG